MDKISFPRILRPFVVCCTVAVNKNKIDYHKFTDATMSQSRDLLCVRHFPSDFTPSLVTRKITQGVVLLLRMEERS